MTSMLHENLALQLNWRARQTVQLNESPQMHESQDHWARWLVNERFGGDETRNYLGQLERIRDRILRYARLKEWRSVPRCRL